MPLLPFRGLIPLAAACVLGACASLPTARIELPAALAAVPLLTLQGPVGAARGDFSLGHLQGRFERSASRLDLLGRLAQDRAMLRYTVPAEGLQADCQLQGSTASLGVLQAATQAVQVRCGYSREGQPLAQQLVMKAESAAAGTRDERRGSFVAEGVTLELRSVHRVQGSPLPLAAPAGYLLTHQGQVVAALDLNDLRPRLWLQAPDPAVATAALQASLALALLWEPASR